MLPHLDHVQFDQPSSTSTPGSKTKRTHARRSCNTCKLRKTRCELPDQMIPSSSAGLPRDKACHRCKTLNLTCVVDDKGRKRGLPRDADGQLIAPKESWDEEQSYDQAYDEFSRPSGRTRGSGSRYDMDDAHSPRSPRRKSTLAAEDGYQYPEEHGDLLHGIVPYPQTGPEDLLAEFQFTPPRAEAMASEQIRNMKLHGRPLELVTAMLGSVYGRKIRKLDLGRLVDDEMRRKLEPGVLSLKTYHPWLSTLDEQFQKYDAKSCTDPATLLLALVIYLASTSIPAQTHQLRSTLTSLIGSLRDSLLLHIPSSLAAIQALELLSLHAPLGALPWEQVHFHNLSVGRGQLSTALAIQQSLGSQAFSFRPDVDPFVHWEYREFWLWMSLVADQARVVLEDEVQELRTPPELADAKLLAERILASGSLHLWSDATSDSDCADLVGRLGVCHRIIRLSLVHETLKAYRSALEGLASDAFYNLVGDVTRLMNEFEVKQRTIEAQYDRIAAIISASPWCKPLFTSGPHVYRQVSWRFEFSRVFMMGVRSLVTSGYLPGTPLSLDGLPTDLPYNERLSYAVEEGINPSNVMRIAIGSTHPGKQQIRDGFTKRGEICDGLLSAFAELNDVLLSNVPSHPSVLDRVPNDERRVPVVPIVELASIAVESNKILMEMRAGQIVAARLYPQNTSPSTYKLPSWFFIMKQVSEIMIRIAKKYDPKRDRPETQEAGYETVLMGCGNLIASMVRVTDDWKRQQSAELASVTGTPVNGAGVGRGASIDSTGSGPYATPGQRSSHSNPSSITPSIATPDIASGSRGYGEYPNQSTGVYDPTQNTNAGLLPQFNYLAQHPTDVSSGYGQMQFAQTDVPQMDGDPNMPPPPAQGFNYPPVDFAAQQMPFGDLSQTQTQGQGQVQGQSQGHGMMEGYVPPAQPQMNRDYAPTALDFLVAQMFNYSYLPASAQQGGGQGGGQ